MFAAKKRRAQESFFLFIGMEKGQNIERTMFATKEGYSLRRRVAQGGSPLIH